MFSVHRDKECNMESNVIKARLVLFPIINMANQLFETFLMLPEEHGYSDVGDYMVITISRCR